MNYQSKSAVLAVAALAVAGLAMAQVEVDSASADPAMVEPGEAVDDQAFVLEIAGLSADGETDYVNLSFPEQFSEGDLEVNSVDSNVSVEEDAELMEGDNGSVVSVGLNSEDDEEMDAEVTFDVSVDYPDDFESMSADVEVEDSEEGSASETVEVNASGTDETVNETDDETVNETDEDLNETDTGNETETPGEDLGPINESDEGPTETDPEDQPGNETETGENGGGGLIESIISFFQNLF